MAGAGLGALAAFLVSPEFRLQAAILTAALVWASAVDIDRFILPDVLTLGLLLAGVAFAVTLEPGDELDRAIGAVAGYAVLGLVAMAYRRWRGRDGLGRGDAKLFAAAGAWLGWKLLPMVMLIASAAALVWVLGSAVLGRKLSSQSRLPFGPFIAAGFWCVWMSEAM
jgi:leader peptidase (prepilin peptidase)/N-methyltransferase